LNYLRDEYLRNVLALFWSLRVLRDPPNDALLTFVLGFHAGLSGADCVDETLGLRDWVDETLGLRDWVDETLGLRDWVDETLGLRDELMRGFTALGLTGVIRPCPGAFVPNAVAPLTSPLSFPVPIRFPLLSPHDSTFAFKAFATTLSVLFP
jgi:hypothetical protein